MTIHEAHIDDLIFFQRNYTHIFKNSVIQPLLMNYNSTFIVSVYYLQELFNQLGMNLNFLIRLTNM